MKNNKEPAKEFIILLSFAVTYFLVRSITPLNYISSYTFGKADTAVWLQQLWCISKSRIPSETLYYFRNYFYNTHFMPIAYIYSFVFYLDNPLAALAILEAASYTIAFFPLYFLARAVTNGKIISLILSTVTLFTYAGNIPHLYFETFLFPYLCFALFFMHRKRYFLATLFFIISISFREYMSLALFILGVVYILKDRKNRYGYLWSCLGLSWMVFAYFLIYKNLIYPFGYLGDSKNEIVRNFFTKTDLWLPFILNKNSFIYLLRILLPMGLLSLFGFEMLLPVFPIIFIHLLGKTVSKPIDIMSHYIVIFAPFLAYSAFLGFSRLNNYLVKRLKRLAAVIPLLLIIFIIGYNSHYLRLFMYKLKEAIILRHALKEHTNDVKEIINLIPENASLSCNDNLTPYFARREKIYNFNFMNVKMEPDYVLYDFLYEDNAIWNDIMRKGWNALRGEPTEYYNSDIAARRYSEGLLEKTGLMDYYRLLRQKGSLFLYKRRS